jgi:hypothetical protein
MLRRRLLNRRSCKVGGMLHHARGLADSGRPGIPTFGLDSFKEFHFGTRCPVDALIRVLDAPDARTKMTRPVFSAIALLMSLAPALGSVPPSGQEVHGIGTRMLQPSSPFAQRQPQTPAARERQLFQNNEISFPGRQ